MENKLIIKRYSEELKRAAVHSVEELGMRVTEVCKHYKIEAPRTLYRWLKRYGNMNRSTQVVRVIMKSEQERIKELESLVADLSVKCKLLKAQVSIYEEITGEESKKKLSTKQLHELEAKKEQLRKL